MTTSAKQWTEALPYFSKGELACKGSGIVLLDIRFAAALIALRHDWNKPLDPSSVCRSPEHNKNERGHPNSLHLTENPKHKTSGTMAADIKWFAWPIEERLEFARFCYIRDWSVGLHNSFCHIDRRKEIGLPQQSFLYGRWNNYFSDNDVKNT